jgi:hypothetical protein
MLAHPHAGTMHFVRTILFRVGKLEVGMQAGKLVLALGNFMGEAGERACALCNSVACGP